MKKRLLPLFVALLLPVAVNAETVADTVRIDFSSLQTDVPVQNGWRYDASKRTVHITGQSSLDPDKNIFLLTGDGAGKVEHLRVSTLTSSLLYQNLKLVMGIPSPIISAPEGEAVKVDLSTIVNIFLQEGSSPDFKCTATVGGAGLYNDGELTISGTGELHLSSKSGAAFYQESGNCMHESGELQATGSVSVYLDKESSYTLGEKATLFSFGDVGVYNNAKLDVSKGVFRAYGFQEELSTAVVSGGQASVTGSILQFTSTEASLSGGVKLELRPASVATTTKILSVVTPPVTIDLPENVISFALNTNPGEYQLIKPGTPEVIEQGVNEADADEKVVTLFTAKENALVTYIKVEPVSGATGNEHLSVPGEVRYSASNGKLTVSLSAPEVIHIYRMNGQPVQTIQAVTGNNVVYLPAGMFIIRIAGKGYKVVL